MTQQVHTRIWLEECEPGKPMQTRAAYCHGYDVYGDMLGRAGWVDMIFLLFRGEAPSRAQAQVLEDLALALANAGPRDPSVHAAMCAGTGGSTAAASLIAALAVGAGQHGGAREVFHAMGLWQRCGADMARWAEALQPAGATVTTIWPERGQTPGFEAGAEAISPLARQLLAHLEGHPASGLLAWLHQRRPELESLAGHPLALTGVVAATLVDLGFTPEQGEMLHLLLRLPGAAAHALEQRALGPSHFPFFELDLLNDPAEREAA